MSVLIRGNTVICSIIVKDEDGTLTNPATSTLCTILDPKGTHVVDEQAMTNDSVGYYHYDWLSASTNAKGTYEVYYKLTDGTRVTIDKDVFDLDFGY